MSKTVAFPVLKNIKHFNTHVVEMSSYILPQVHEILSLRTSSYYRYYSEQHRHLFVDNKYTHTSQESSNTSSDNSSSNSNITNNNTDDGVSFTLRVGSSVAIPLTVIGAEKYASNFHAKKFKRVFSLASMQMEDVEDETLYVHSPGLAGAFAMQMSELYTCRGTIDYQPNDFNQNISNFAYKNNNSNSNNTINNNNAKNVNKTNDINNNTNQQNNNNNNDDDYINFTKCQVAIDSLQSRELGMLCVLSALEKANNIENDASILDIIYRMAVRRHFAVNGMSSLITCGSSIFTPNLQLDFPYHCGGVHAEKKYLDITTEAVALFNSSLVHGAKMLNRYGVAVCVGVGVPHLDLHNCANLTNTHGKKRHLNLLEQHSLDAKLVSLTPLLPSAEGELPELYWHPSGAPAACTSPLLHGVPLLHVGNVALSYNGPTRECALLIREDVRRYMNTPSNNISSSSNSSNTNGNGNNEGNEEEELDTSEWLCHGLFGVHMNAEWLCKDDKSNDVDVLKNMSRNELRVAGVKYNSLHHEFDLYLRDCKSNLLLLADVT